jgi:hypothetical protein
MAVKYFRDGSPMWICVKCSKPLDYEVDKSFDACPEHKDDVDLMKKSTKKKQREDEFNDSNKIVEDGAIICPYCYEEQPDIWESGPTTDGECDLDFACCSCEEKFEVSVSISYAFTTERKNG